MRKNLSRLTKRAMRMLVKKSRAEESVLNLGTRDS